MTKKTQVTKVASEPIQIGPGQHVIVENSAVNVLTQTDVQLVLQMLCSGYELLGAFPWGEMTLVILKRVMDASPPSARKI